MEMNCIYLVEPEVFQDENAIPCSSDSTGGLEEDNCLYFVVPELKLELFEKFSRNLPLILVVRQSKNSSIRSLKSCPCSNELIFPNYIDLISPNRKFAQHCIGSAELSSDSIHIFCRAESLLSIRMNAGYMFKSLKMRRRSRNINDLHDFIVASSPATHSVNVIVGPSGRWIFDSIEANIKARTFIKSSLFFKLGNSDDTMGQIRSRSTSTRQIEFSELTSAPSGLFNTSSQEPMMTVIPFRKQKAMSNFSEEMLLFCSTTNLSCSYQSSSSAHHFTSTGLLRCVWKSGTPHFVFSLNDDPREFLANLLKIKSSADRAMDYMYLFHSKTDNRKDSRNPVNGASNVVGKMKVSSTLVLNSNRSKFIETEFVLFGANEDHFKEIPSSSSRLMKRKGLSKKVAGIFRPSHSSKHTSTHKVGEASSQSEGLEEVSIGEVSNFDELFTLNHLADDFPPNFESAAIVVEDYQHDSNKLAARGGWGLSFLDRASRVDNCPEPSSASENREEILMRDSRKSARRMNVLVPAGFHGGPITRTGGPSSLIERWRSGGHCDCGGWDIGCPLTVLNNCCIHSNASPPEESEEDRSSVDLFMEGAKHGEPMLKLVNSSEGLYIIYFQSTLSALQSFSIAVAIIHSQTPDLDPKL